MRGKVLDDWRVSSVSALVLGGLIELLHVDLLDAADEYSELFRLHGLGYCRATSIMLPLTTL